MKDSNKEAGYLIKITHQKKIVYIGFTLDNLSLALYILTKKKQLQKYINNCKVCCAAGTGKEKMKNQVLSLAQKYKPILNDLTVFSEELNNDVVEPGWERYTTYLARVYKEPQTPDEITDGMVVASDVEKRPGSGSFERWYYYIYKHNDRGVYLFRIRPNGSFGEAHFCFWNDFFKRYTTSAVLRTPQMSVIDNMTGLEFEAWCAALLKRKGFSNVQMTRASGDQGVDLLAEKEGVRYAIQCKCYSHDLGNTPVQEVYAGKAVYSCHVAAVMTNRYFTAGGWQAAQATGVLIWDRDWLQKSMNG